MKWITWSYDNHYVKTIIKITFIIFHLLYFTFKNAKIDREYSHYLKLYNHHYFHELLSRDLYINHNYNIRKVHNFLRPFLIKDST